MHGNGRDIIWLQLKKCMCFVGGSLHVKSTEKYDLRNIFKFGVEKVFMD